MNDRKRFSKLNGVSLSLLYLPIMILLLSQDKAGEKYFWKMNVTFVPCWTLIVPPTQLVYHTHSQCATSGAPQPGLKTTSTYIMYRRGTHCDLISCIESNVVTCHVGHEIFSCRRSWLSQQFVLYIIWSTSKFPLMNETSVISHQWRLLRHDTSKHWYLRRSWSHQVETKLWSVRCGCAQAHSNARSPQVWHR